MAFPSNLLRTAILTAERILTQTVTAQNPQGDMGRAISAVRSKLDPATPSSVSYSDARLAAEKAQRAYANAQELAASQTGDPLGRGRYPTDPSVPTVGGQPGYLHRVVVATDEGGRTSRQYVVILSDRPLSADELRMQALQQLAREEGVQDSYRSGVLSPNATAADVDFISLYRRG